ncbi:MAG: flippase [Candidatus Methanosuratincola sp.]
MEKTANLPVSKTIKPAAYDRNILTVAKGGGVTYAGKLFLSVTRIVTSVLLARLLGANQYGMYTLALSASNIAVGIAVFGLDSALIRYVAILANRRDEKGLWGALQVGIGTAMLLSVLTGTFLFAFATIIAERTFQEPQLAPLLQLVSVIVPFLTLSEILAGANRGFKRMDYAVIAQFVAQPVIRLVLIGILAFSGFNTVHAILTFGLADLSASLLLLYYLNKEFSLKRSLLHARRDLREIFNFSIPFWLSDMMLWLKNNLQPLLIGTLNTITGVGVFSIVNNITRVSGEFASSINTSSKPIIAELHDRGDVKQLGRIYQTANKWNVMVQLPIFLIMVLFPGQILSIFGSSFAAGATTLVVLAFADLVSVGTGMGGTIIDMTGYTKLKLLNSTIRIALYFILDILLIPRFGLIGAAMAILLGELVVNLLRLIQVFVLFRILPFNRSFAKPVTSIGLALACSMLLNIWFPADSNYFMTILHMVLVVMIYAAAILSLGLNEEERTMLVHARQRVQRMVSRSQREHT